MKNHGQHPAPDMPAPVALSPVVHVLDDDEAVTPQDASLETWLVARFTGAPAAVRTSVVPGLELRQAMSCAM